MSSCSVERKNSLQRLCHYKINRDFALERQLFHYHVCGDLGYVYRYERIVNDIRFLVNNRHLKSQKPFEKWFRRLVNQKMDVITQNTDYEKKMLRVAKELSATISKFRKIYGVTLQVLAKTKSLIFVLERMK